MPIFKQTFEELKASGQLPSPPGVGMRILKLTQSENFSAEELGRTIMTDPALTGRLLKLANAATSGSMQPVTTVPEATMRLGVRAVKNIALGLSLLSAYRSGMCDKFNYDRYWSMSLARAVAAQNISRHLRQGVPAEAYILGLLADIGSLALASVHPTEYAVLLTAAPGKRGADLSRLERVRFEIDHSEVGAYMLEEWGLPAHFSQAVQLFEGDSTVQSDNREVAAMARVLQFAQLVADICLSNEITSKTAWARFSSGLETLREALEMDRAQFTALCTAITKEWTDWGQMLQVPTQKVQSVTEIHERARALAQGASEPDSGVAAEVKSATKGLRILAVDDELMSLKLLERTLTKAGHQVVTAQNGNEALRVALETSPQAVICDWMMPEMDGLDLCRALRRIECGRNMFFLLLTGRSDEDRIIEAFDAGVDDYVSKPFNSRVLLARIKGGQRLVELQQKVEGDRKIMMKQVAEMGLLTRKLRNAALTDVLTELTNRRYAMKRLEAEWTGALRAERPLSIISIDIDFFKKVNDTYGHDIGDLVLKETANVLRSTTRQGEEASRLGGEEFLVICPNTTEAQAAIAAERLRAAVEGHKIENSAFNGHVTISLGVAERTAEMVTHDALLKAADDAVYAAKHAGRNRFALAGSCKRVAKSA
jgi:two-component system, cell cycle response regulator